MYDIKVDRIKGVVHVTLGGMMPVDEVAAYIIDLKRAFVMNALHSYALVIDARDCPIQAQDMVQAMGEHMRTMPKARAIGVVIGTSLARMQARRLFTQPYARIVETVDQARDWVYSGIEPPVERRRDPVR